MAISRIKQIKRILKDGDVRDPRGALAAIEQVLAAKPARTEPKPVIKLEVIDHGDRGELRIKSHKQIEPKHIGLAIDGLRDLAIKKTRECNECKGKPPVKELLETLFAQFEADLQKKGSN
jgi:hypothetical protein